MEILGIDIGGTGIKGAPVKVKSGQMLTERFRIPTPSPSTPAAIAEAVNLIAKNFNWKGNIGIGFPAVVQNGIVKTASNIHPSWIGVQGEELFGRATKCPVKLINDADCAGIAEMKFGQGKSFKGLAFMLTVGTGIGTALFIKRRLVPNSELGHVLLNTQTAEEYASDSVRKNLNLDIIEWSSRFNEYLFYLEKLFWPELFIVGGGISKKFESVMPHLTVSTKVLPALLLNDAGLIGAAISAKKLSKKDFKKQFSI